LVPAFRAIVFGLVQSGASQIRVLFADMNIQRGGGIRNGEMHSFRNE